MANLVGGQTASNVWEKFDLVNAHKWHLEATEDAGEPLIIKYIKETGFIFNGTSAASLNELCDDSGA